MDDSVHENAHKVLSLLKMWCNWDRDRIFLLQPLQLRYGDEETDSAVSSDWRIAEGMHELYFCQGQIDKLYYAETCIIPEADNIAIPVPPTALARGEIRTR